MEKDWWETEYGRLVIDFNTITISGPIHHLQGFTKTIPLEGYSEDGFIYIKDSDAWQAGVAFIQWTAGDRVTELLTLTGGGLTNEVFKKVEE
jgi:hypothetical protein